MELIMRYIQGISNSISAPEMWREAKIWIFFSLFLGLLFDHKCMFTLVV